MKSNCGNSYGSYFRTGGNPLGKKEWCCTFHEESEGEKVIKLLSDYRGKYSDTNLLTETKELLAELNIPTSAVKWVGTSAEAITWDEFEALAKDINYSSDYGAQEVVSDLVVVGEDWWLERSEYDGSEGWEYKTLPKKPSNKKSNSFYSI